MSNGTPVPATALSTIFYPNTTTPSQLVIGQSSAIVPGTASTSCIWLVVVDLTTCGIVASDVSDGSSVPSDISQYAGSATHFLFAISNNAWASQMPQGALWDLLTAAGSGPELNKLQQIYATLGTGNLGTFSYILAATLAEDDMPGFEAFSMTDFTILTMAFMPVTVNGQTVYAPIQQGG